MQSRLNHYKIPINMKRILFFLLLILSINICSIATEYIVYVPNTQNENFIKSNIDVKNKSIDNICEELGYSPLLYYTWFTKDYKTTICFKILSMDIICVITTSYKDTILPLTEIEKILMNNNYDYNKAYNTSNREKNLNEGISKRLLNKSFIESIIHKKIADNKLVDNTNGYTYTFEGDYMVSYISNDGLIGYAKELKDTDLFNIIKTNAEKYNTAEKAVVDEINMQFEYMAKINMQYLSLAKSDKYNYNYALLYIDFYNHRILMIDFVKIIHDSAEVLKITPNITILKYNFNYYSFDKDKILYKIE